ncbi:MAG: SpoIIE family protein phosphatase [Ignavibacteriales bacterium]|nr:SpoIIE family protein phosphatase [Ignavibacteriales bacterium]
MLKNVENNQIRIFQLEEENSKLKTSVQELSVLNEIATAISSTLSIEDIVELIVKKCIKHLKVEQCAVMLLDKKPDSQNFHTLIRKEDESKGNLPLKLDLQLTGWMILNKSPLISNDLKNDTRFVLNLSGESIIKSLISVPLLMKGNLIGILAVFNKKNDREFTHDEERLLSIIGAQSAHVIENARLFEDEKKLEILQEELERAAEIQKNLLPARLPVIDGFDFYAVNIPAKEVGGDYYDFINIDENKMAFCLGDVSGKGLPAALLMANLQATLRSQILFNLPCCQAINRSNLLLYRSTEAAKFVTLFIGMIDPLSDKLKFCNAGHNYPILISNDGKITRLKDGGIILGCLPNYPYSEGEIEFKNGDLLFIFTDGITEAMNFQKDEYGEEKLIEELSIIKDNSCEEIAQKILTSVKSHIKDEPQSDDMTLLIIKKISHL